MSWYAVGIDPGKTGALAVIRNDGFPGGIWDYPGDPASLWAMLRNSLLNDPNSFDVRLAVLEKVSAMPKQGVSSTFKFGTNFGIWQATVVALRWPMELITPQRWRKVLDSSVPQKPTKEDLRAYAIKRWPAASESLNRVKDHNRAEALIMAEYARLKVLG
jgi:hypothetical protein